MVGPRRAVGRALGLGAATLLLLAGRLGAAAPAFDVPGRVDPGPHPRSLCLPADRAAIQARLGREPYRSLLAWIQTVAGQEHDPADDDVLNGHERANTARSAALLFWLDRTLDSQGNVVPLPDLASRRALGEKAAYHLLRMNTRSWAKGLLDATLDIHTAQELHLWVDTLDLLLAVDPTQDPELDVLGSDRTAAIQSVADLAADFYADYCLTNWVMLRAETANHRSKSSAALALAALVLNGEDFLANADDGRYDPALWLDFGMRYTELVVRDLQTDADGGCQEGPGYLGYAAIDFVPLLWTWHHYTGGASFPVDWDTAHAPYYAFHATGTYEIPDLWSTPWLGRQIDWLVRTSLPDGTQPPFDDNGPGGRFFFGVFVHADLPHAGLYRWAWDRAARATGGSVDVTPLTLVTLDDSIPAVDPATLGWTRHQALPYAGQVVLRSGWDDRAVVALLLAEHGRAAGWTQTRWGDYVDGAAGHEHPDGTAVALWAYGEELALDPGYLGWENHAAVNRPEHHNLLLVDGAGADINRYTVPAFEFDDDMNIVLTNPVQEGGYAPALDGQAYLVRWSLDTAGVAFGEIVTETFVNTPDTQIRRQAVLLADRFVVLFDAADPVHPDGDHDFTVQIHGHGGGTSGGDFLLEPDGATWTRAQARLVARVISADPVSFHTREGTHDPGWWTPLTHTVLDATVRGPRARFVTLLAPEPVPVGDATLLPIDTTACPGTCVRFGAPGLDCLAWTGQAYTPHLGDTPLWEAGWGAYCDDGQAVAGTFGDVDGDPAALYTARFTADASGTLADFEVTVLGHDPAALRATLSLPRIAARAVSGACQVTPVGDRWEIAAPVGVALRTVAPTAPIPAVVARLRLAGVAPDEPAVVALGATATIDAQATCAPDPFSITWDLQDRPELSRVGLSGTAPQVSFTPDLPGLYRVRATFASSDATVSATLAFEVEGEVPWPATPDAGVEDAADAGDATPLRRQGGCGCAATPGAAPIPLGLVLCLVTWGVVRRRRAS